ncbi:MAG: ATP-binding cassette domain-containing protein [Clostridia bacterium]|nr:ATP-binding cassette domain-containing protein [Clostridia bacterium]
MSWVEEQIKQRIHRDNQLYDDAMARMDAMAEGKPYTGSAPGSRELVGQAMDEILRYYHVKPPEIPDSITDTEEMLEYLLRPSGIMHRTVSLTGDWYTHATGAMLAATQDGTVIALIPGRARGYYYRESATGKRIRITKANADTIAAPAICFYQPMPQEKMTAADYVLYLFRQLQLKDFLRMAAATLLMTLLGLLIPVVTAFLYSKVLADKSIALLAGAVLSMLCVRLAMALIDLVKRIMLTDITAGISSAAESALMMRLLSLPASFFKQYGAGELSGRITCARVLAERLFSALFTLALSSVFALMYVIQLAKFAPALMFPAVLVILVTFMIQLTAGFIRARYFEQYVTESTKESGLVLALMNGLTKIRVSGSEKRAFSKWSEQYIKAAKNLYNVPAFLTLRDAITAAVTLAGTLVMYCLALASGITQAEYLAFFAAYGMLSGAFAALADIAYTNAEVKPLLNMIAPMLAVVPEVGKSRRMVTSLRGGIELSHVSFRYQDNMPDVLDDLSLTIRPGQYVGIVGKTGCGKSTLMRILLGFEKPQRGTVYYDRQDIAALDLKSLRRHIGTVMQNDRLFMGDIFSNITIAAPKLTLDDAWQAAETAGVADDIREMPMGMHTFISEGQGGISGGQRQRLLIARAIAPKPKILLFDEATSALDNITQKKVSDALAQLKCTRIVIAHRLSTIRNCDRILVMDRGKIIEDGTYDQLMAADSFFAELVRRQQVTQQAN